MALIIEDGTNVANSNSYIDLDYAADYHTMVGNDDWSGDDSSLELALIQSAQSLDLLFGPKYLSQRLPGTQSLLWPRYSFYDNYLNLIVQGVIPVALKNAQAEIALLALTGVDILPEENSENSILAQKQKVGEIEVDITYRTPAPRSTYDAFRKVELLLYPVIHKRGKQGQPRLVR